MQALGPADKPGDEHPVSHHMIDDVSEFGDNAARREGRRAPSRPGLRKAIFVKLEIR